MVIVSMGSVNALYMTVITLSIVGYRMVHALLRPAVLDVIDLATHYRSIELQIEEVQIPKDGVGTVSPCKIRESGKLWASASSPSRPNGEMVFNPSSDARIIEGDRLVVIGQTANLRDLERRLQTG